MKNILKVHAVVACFIVSIAANAASGSDIIIKSPDTHIAFHLSLQNNQNPNLRFVVIIESMYVHHHLPPFEVVLLESFDVVELHQVITVMSYNN